MHGIQKSYNRVTLDGNDVQKGYTRLPLDGNPWMATLNGYIGK